MTDRLEDLLRGCTIRVLGGPMPGAGFFVAPGKVLTCVHVVGDPPATGLRVRWERDDLAAVEFPVTGQPLVLPSRGRPIPNLDRDYPDIAVLDVAAPEDHPCVWLEVTRPTHEDALLIFGFPEEGGGVHLTPAVLSYRSLHGTAPTSFWDLGSDTVKPGMSGAAVLNLRSGGIGGVIVASKHPAKADGALAVPWDEVAVDLADVLAANRAFHERDRRWRDAVAASTTLPAGLALRGAPVVTVTIEAMLAESGLTESGLTESGTLSSRVRIGETVLCARSAALPAEMRNVWGALRLPGLVASDRLTAAGRSLAGALLDDDGQRVLADRLRELPPEALGEVVLVARGAALSLPLELIRLAGDGTETGPLSLLPNVSVTRRVSGATPAQSPISLPGPLKILAAVAAPDETKTRNSPLDTEAEMGAVLAAVSAVADGSRAQVRILEVASLQAIRDALESDAYHVLHLSAHGSPLSVELEDEDGAPVTVLAEDLMGALKHAGRPLPLIVLSACSGGATGSDAMAAGLLGHGADRVVAMLAPVSDTFATDLARHLYYELAAHPVAGVGQALARARIDATEVQQRRAQDSKVPVAPEYGVATLLAKNADNPLIDLGAPEVPLSVATTPPGGKGVRELPLGSLIGRRAQLRDVMGVLRRTERSVDRFGAANGVVLTGVGGIGKTALAGRAISRLRDEGWLIAVHEGRWNPTALIAAVADALMTSADLRPYLEALARPDADDGPKLGLIARLLASQRLLLVFDDFEQNLTPGGGDFLDPAASDAICGLADAAEVGVVLVTCRYPLPGHHGFLVTIAVPPLSDAELRRMFLRLPALRDLDASDKRLLIRTIGGHPRLIEFTDALLRGGRSNLQQVQRKLRTLADREGVPLAADASLETALSQAMLLGSADILLEELLALLTPRQADILHQVAVCYGAMTVEDLAFALEDPDLAALRADVNRLTDLTLLNPGPDVEMHPWTADLVSRKPTDGLATLHERAVEMRYRRFSEGRGTYDDLIDIPRHQAALGLHDEVAAVAGQAAGLLAGTLTICAYLAEVIQLVPETERARSLIADNLGDALVRAGDLDTARTAYQASLDIRQRLTAADPANTQWQRDLSVSHNKLGDIATAAGDLDTARTAYQASLDIAQRLTAADPANTQWQRDLSVSHDKLGNIATAAGDLDTARTAYQASLDIRQRLTAADPANTEWQRDLSVSHDKLGNIARAADDISAARARYAATLAIRERLASRDPRNAQWQDDLAFVRQQLNELASKGKRGAFGLPRAADSF